MTLEIFDRRAVGPLACNCYIVGDPETNEAIVIDPGGEADELAAVIASKGLTVTAIVASHAHFDHILAAERLRELTGAPFHLHRADHPLLDWMETSVRIFLAADSPPPPAVDTSVDDGDVLTAGAVELAVRHTPGHSPGSITLVAPGRVFCGDLLFAGSVGRTDLPGGDARALVKSIEDALFVLDDDTPVHPGHGPDTTVEQEKRSNPFVGRGSGLWLPPT